MVTLERVFCTLLNHTPLFHISCDQRFGQYHATTPRRLSLLVISFWKWKLYIISINSQRKFELLKLINFDLICPMPSQAEVDNKTDSFRKHLTSTSASTEAANIQYESLKERFNQNTSIKSSFDNKVSAYASSYVVLLGFYAYLFNEMWKLTNNNLFYTSCVVIFICALFTATAGLYIWGFLKLKNTIRSRFFDLKTEPTAQNQAVLTYTNWYSSEKEGTVHASYIRNIETNMATSLLLGLGLWIFVFLSSNYLSSQTHPPLSTAQETEIINESGDLKKQNLSTLLSIIQNADSSQNYTLYVISNAEVQSSIKEQVIKTLKLLLTPEKIKEVNLSTSVIKKSMTIKLELSK
ncbi:hypothetical protein [Pseudomonas sp. AM14(2022)]|nr:hypothetical protein [Pseudomonas sp. AM14(2022)]